MKFYKSERMPNIAFKLQRSFTASKSRLGVFECYRGQDKKCLETPGLLSYTRCGVIPYITPDLANEMIFDPLAFTCGPLNGLFQSQETFNAGALSSELGVRDMLGSSLQDTRRPFFYLSTMSDQAATGFLPGLNRSDGVPVFLVGGKVTISLGDQIALLRKVKPDALQVICDNDTEKSCPKKRLEKSYARSVSYLNETVKFLEQDVTADLKNAGLFASLVGGYSPQMRSKFANEVKQVEQSLSGYIIDGLHYGGTSTLNEDFNLNSPEFVELVESSLSPLSAEKIRYLPGYFKPQQIVDAVVNLGVDLFDSSYVYHLTEQGHALLFDSTLADSLQVKDLAKSCSIVDFKIDKSGLQDKFSPLDESCPCYACSKPFTQAYLCHLIAVDEILGLILLMIHNLTSLHLFLASLRKNLSKMSE